MSSAHNTPPPGPDENHGPALVGAISTLEAMTVVVYVARIYSRTVPRRRLWWDDLCITVAMLFNFTEYILMVISVSHGLGRHNVYLTPDEVLLAGKFLFISQPPYAWALVFAKISITMTLLRVMRETAGWRWFLYSMIVFQVLIAITMNAFQLSLCTPLPAVWGDPSVTSFSCLPPQVAQASIYATAGATILTDVTLSLIPLTFIVQLQRPLREKLAIAFIMGLGLVASSASIYKTTLVSSYGVTGDTLTDGVNLTFWSMLEMLLGIMAACMPALKQLFERLLKRVGLLSRLSSRSDLRAQRSGYMYDDNRNGSHPSHKLRIIRTTITSLSTNSATGTAPYPTSSADGTSRENILPMTKD